MVTKKAIKRLPVFFFLIFSISFIHLLIMAETTSLGFKIAGRKTDVAKLRSENRALSVAAAREGSLSRIENLAKTKLGMIEQQNVEYIYLTTRESSAEMKKHVEELKKM
jgi:hypothetical protein